MRDKRFIFAFPALVLSIIILAGIHVTPRVAAQSPDKLLFADFEKLQDNRPVSARGGYVQLFGGSENSSNPAKFTGMPGLNNAPELVRIRPDDPNRAAAFSYTLSPPNAYANVTLEIHGLPDKDGKLVSEDVSGYKDLSFQLYAKGTPAPTGVQYIRVELTSHGQGINLDYGFPQAVLKLSPTGLNTYKVPFKSLSQPSWVETRVDTKEVLRKLTSVQISVYCEQCTPINGTVVVDNVAFEK